MKRFLQYFLAIGLAAALIQANGIFGESLDRTEESQTFSLDSGVFNESKKVFGSIWGNALNTLDIKRYSSLPNNSGEWNVSKQNLNGASLIGNFRIDYEFFFNSGRLFTKSRLYWEWANFKNTGFPIFVYSYLNGLKDTIYLNKLEKYPDLLKRFNSIKPQFVGFEAAITGWIQREDLIDYNNRERLNRIKDYGSTLINMNSINDYLGQYKIGFNYAELGVSGEEVGFFNEREVDLSQFANCPSLSEIELSKKGMLKTFKCKLDNNASLYGQVESMFLINNSFKINFNQGVKADHFFNPSKYRYFTLADELNFSPTIYVHEVGFDSKEIESIINEMLMRERMNPNITDDEFWKTSSNDKNIKGVLLNRFYNDYDYLRPYRYSSEDYIKKSHAEFQDLTNPILSSKYDMAVSYFEFVDEEKLEWERRKADPNHSPGQIYLSIARNHYTIKGELLISVQVLNSIGHFNWVNSDGTILSGDSYKIDKTFYPMATEYHLRIPIDMDIDERDAPWLNSYKDSPQAQKLVEQIVIRGLKNQFKLRLDYCGSKKIFNLE